MMVQVDPNKNNLRHLSVNDAMRRQIIKLDQDKSIGHGINTLIKFKVNALLTVDSESNPIGVVSKTDIMGAYYAGLPIESPLEYIMVSPPLFCKATESLETALEQMRSHGIYRLYITDPESGDLVGALAYPDIVGMLYLYCRHCEFSILSPKKRSALDDSIRRFTVREIMTTGVQSIEQNTTVNEVMETLSAYRFGALLVIDENGLPCGAISKTDLALTYKHGIETDVAASTVMTSPIQTCEADSLLEDAIKKMVLADIHRLFVHENEENNIIGVLSLSDAARGRSGSCHGCVSSRIKVEDHG